MIPIIVVNIDRISSFAYGFGGPVVIVETKVLLGNFQEVVALSVVILGVPGELEGSVYGVTPNTITFFCAGQNAGTYTVHLIVHEFTHMNLVPPTFINGNGGRLTRYRVIEGKPGYDENGEVKRVCSGSIVGYERVVQLNGEGIGCSHFSFVEPYCEGCFLLAINKSNGTKLEDAVSRYCSSKRHSNGSAGICAGNRNGYRAIHLRIIGVCSACFLYREINSVAECVVSRSGSPVVLLCFRKT